ncbi:sensor histidine kinase [Paenibacillus thailandensis]|uniref:Sensor histidine kinase n=1 Tax=Paenibacillus thailandensis TaxID=393250 RepID=A0ABW5QUK4_9BACL
MENWLGRSLKNKLSVMIILAVLVPLVSLGLFSYTIAERLSEEKAKMTGMNTLRQLEAYMGSVINDVENMSLFLIGSNEVQQYLKSPRFDYLKQSSLISFLTNLAFSKAYISSILITPIAAEGTPVSNKTLISSEFADITAEIPDYYEKHPKWWSSVYSEMTSDGLHNVFTLSRPIRSTTNRYKPIGHLNINLNQQVISDHLKQAGLEGGGYVVLLDDEGRIMAGPDGMDTEHSLADYLPGLPSLDGDSGSMNYGTEDAKRTILYRTISGVDWKLVGVIPFQTYGAQNRYFLTLTAAAVSLAIVFVIAFVVFLIIKVTKPLTVLTKQLKNANPEEPLPAMPVNSIDEVGQLIIGYNRLSSKIVMLTDEVKRNESMKKEADMVALQAQINPHFLYNTLSSIHWMALMNKDERIARMVGSLSDFLRFSLNGGREYCKVQQEIDHARHYVNIQSIRYPERFRLEWDIEESLLPHTMLKLLLQPLIENAMLHGILKRDGLGTIRITGRQAGDTIRFAVEDDGVGMEAGRLEELRTRMQTADFADNERSGKGSYGLRNVNGRLILHYGSEAKLAIESKPGQGTKVSFAVRCMKEEDHDEAYDR